MLITVSSMLMIVCFILVIFFILLNKINRAIVSISGAVITYYILIFFEGKDYSIVVDLLFGTPDDGFVNLRTIILIIGIMFIVQIAEQAGVFQFLAAYVIKRSNGNPILLMIIFCFLAVGLSAILNNIITVMILIPLTILISRILNTNPTPYILTQAVLVNIGGTIFSISSIPNILITTASNISFGEFFLNVGLFSIIVVCLTIIFFIFLYKSELTKPDDHLIETLAQFDVWNVVQSKKLFFTSLLGIIVLLLSFLIIPVELVPPDIIAITIAMIMVIVTYFQNVDENKILNKLDYQLILYLLGIFVIAGGLEVTGIIDSIASLLNNLGSNLTTLTQIISIMWIAAILSSLIDNIPITKVLVPIVDDFIPESASSEINKRYFYGLSMGANWGDNLTPLGDNILVINLAEQNNRPIRIFDFWRLGFITTMFQLMIASLYFIILFDVVFGAFFIGILLLAYFSLWILNHKFEIMSDVMDKIRNIIIG
ncbi:MAG: Arsenical pump membrane protein [Candidatus Heimdallarchaeota archaeon LC_3]|nr:MAG: Arsenical pump membrane protein [Candidatus Heimdallarchaeota archaeon LC_3]